MKKFFRNIVFVLVFLIFLSNKVYASETKLIVNLEHEGINAKLYKLGKFKDEKLELDPAFKSLEKNNFTKDNIYKDIKGHILNDFENIIEKENIKPVQEFKSDKNKKVVFNQDIGLYIVTYDKFVNGDKVIMYKSNFIDLINNDIKIFAKHEIHPKEEFQRLDIIKVWHDENYKKRPQKIFVNIYSEGEKIDRIELSKINNWRYSYSKLRAESNYKLIEEVPKGYNSKVEYGYKTAIINNYLDKSEKKDENQSTNNNKKPDSNKKNKLPNTGVLWWPVVVLLSLGILFLVIYIFSRNKREK